MSSSTAKNLGGFQFQKHETYNVLKMPFLPDQESISEVERQLAADDQLAKHNLLVDCSSLQELTPLVSRFFVLLSMRWKGNKAALRLILVPEKVKSAIKTQGIDRAVMVVATLDDALKTLAVTEKRKGIDVNVINPFVSSTVNVLKVQCGVEAKAGQIFRKSGGEQVLADISGVIAIVSPTFTGSVVISFPEKTFLQLMSLTLGETYTTITQEIQDGAGEMTNIIFGQAKVVLNKAGYAIQMAMPSIITGKDHTVLGAVSGTAVVIPFESSVGPFIVAICVSN